MSDHLENDNGSGNGSRLEHPPVPTTGPVRAIERRRRLLPAIVPSAPVVAAAGGLAAGAATIATVRAVRSRRRTRLGRRRRKEVQRSVVATRSFLVDVHLLGR
ncbi:MAG: hypothetical protein WDZ37_05280 [Solirubrobacterales bacterium]